MNNTQWTQKVVFPNLYMCIYVTIVTKRKETIRRIHESERRAWRQEGKLWGTGKGC